MNKLKMFGLIKMGIKLIIPLLGMETVVNYGHRLDL
jgi:hypothetical protein